MIPYLDHLLLWGAFVLAGIAFGFFMGYALVPAGKGTRL